jgi:hypothetical protein
MDRLPGHDPRRFEDMPLVLWPSEDARRTDQARQVLVDSGLDDSRSVRLVGDEVHREGELQRTVGSAIDIGVDREVEVAGQHMTGIDKRPLRMTSMGAANRVPDVSLRPDSDRPGVEHDERLVELG